MALVNFSNQFEDHSEFGSNLTTPFRPLGSNIIATLTPLYWILAVIIVIINGLLLILFIRHKTVRKSLNYFILSQIVTDLSVGCVALPVSLLLPRQRLIGNTSINDPLCLFSVVSSISIMTMMLWGVALTAIDRLVAVLRPTSYKELITKLRCSLAVLFLWFSVLLFFLLPVFNLETLGGYKWRSYCNGLYRYPVGYLQSAVFLHLALPILVTTMAYLSMYIVIRRKHKLSMIHSSSVRVDQGLRKAVSAAKTCLITTALIILGWSPFLIMLNVVPMYEVSFLFRLYAYGISMLLAAMVSALNPLVYFLRLKTIQQVFCNGGCRKRNRVDDVTRTTEVTPYVDQTNGRPMPSSTGMRSSTNFSVNPETSTVNPETSTVDTKKHTTNTSNKLIVS